MIIPKYQRTYEVINVWFSHRHAETTWWGVTIWKTILLLHIIFSCTGNIAVKQSVLLFPEVLCLSLHNILLTTEMLLKESLRQRHAYMTFCNLSTGLLLFSKLGQIHCWYESKYNLIFYFLNDFHEQTKIRDTFIFNSTLILCVHTNIYTYTEKQIINLPT